MAHKNNITPLRDGAAGDSRPDVKSSFAQFATGLGLVEPRGGFVADGKLHRCDVAANPRNKRNAGSYQLFSDGIPAGWAQNWTDGTGPQTWCLRPENTLAPAERAELRQRMERARRQREVEEKRRHNEAAGYASAIWAKSQEAPADHAYLSQKRVRPHGLRIDDAGNLVLPLRDETGALHSLQTIAPDGSKRFLTGGRKRGLFHTIGEIDAAGRILICEGYATAASVHEATGLPAIVAFDCGNLLPVAEVVRRKYPGAAIVVCADDDFKTEGNPGLTKAREASQTIGAAIALPQFIGERNSGTDFNDLAQAEGTDAVIRCIEAAGGPATIAPDGERQPLEDLVERTATDPGAPFAPAVIERLAALKGEDRAAFEALRAQLKRAGCRVTALDDAIAEESGEPGGRGPTQADILIDLAQSAELFHAPDGTGFADLDINGHRETWPTRSKGFRRWLARRFFEETGGAPSSEALQSALNVIEARAHFDAPERTVYVRIGGLDGRLYLDLGDETWRAVEIDAAGWRVIDSPPVRFRRAAGMQALPVPVAGGSVGALRSFLNVRSDADFVLVVAWALACLRNRGPYPVLVLSGEQGSAKSTFSAMLRALLDPNTAPLRALPREDRDLFIAASNGHVLAFDNVSGLPAWISDTLCRLATGGGFAVRQLYSDQDEVLFDAARPVILNGIEDIVTRPDLADRALFLALEPIPEERRRPEQELWAAFEAERPRILGALLDAASKGLAMLPHTRLDKLPRMADFALWATACEGALWPNGTFWSAYCGNRDEAVDEVIDADPVAAAVRALMAARTEWTGTASELLSALAEMAGERIAKTKTWPDSARALAGRLRRAATFLRKIGIEIGFEREGRARTRIIRITAAPPPPFAPEKGGIRPSAPSAPSVDQEKSISANGLASHGLRTVGGRSADDADGSADGTRNGTVRANPLKYKGADGADGADAKFPHYSEREKRGGVVADIDPWGDDL